MQGFHDLHHALMADFTLEYDAKRDLCKIPIQQYEYISAKVNTLFLSKVAVISQHLISRLCTCHK